MKKYLAALGVITAVSTLGLTGAGIAHAATSTSTQTDPMSSLVDAIATKFNLKKADVQSVVDAQKTQMQAQREQQVKDEVAALVTSGKLTQDQADKINAKRTALEAERDASRTTDQSKTDTERKTEMDQQKTALDTWLKDNGISTDYAYLLMGGGHGGRGMHGDGMGRGSSTSTSTSSTNSSTN